MQGLEMTMNWDHSASPGWKQSLQVILTTLRHFGVNIHSNSRSRHLTKAPLSPGKTVSVRNVQCFTERCADAVGHRVSRSFTGGCSPPQWPLHCHSASQWRGSSYLALPQNLLTGMKWPSAPNKQSPSVAPATLREPMAETWGAISGLFCLGSFLHRF